jgi:hypothetical protein
MTLFRRRKRGDEGVNVSDEDDETPRDVRELLGGGSLSLPTGRAYIDAWRDSWIHQGRLPRYVTDQSGNVLWPLLPPDLQCPEDGCPRAFPDNAVGQAALENHIEVDHGGILRRIAKAVRRG